LNFHTDVQGLNASEAAGGLFKKVLSLLTGVAGDVLRIGVVVTNFGASFRTLLSHGLDSSPDHRHKNPHLHDPIKPWLRPFFVH
jgi:hypothetical protein